MVRLLPSMYIKFQNWRLQSLLLALAVVTLLIVVLYKVGKLPSSLMPAGSGHRKGTAGLSHRTYPVNFLEEDCEMCDDKAPLRLDPEARTHTLLVRELGQEKIELYRHFDGFEPWPQIQLDLSLPGKVPSTVHYLWCKRNMNLGFHHYLGLLSAVRLLQPVKLIFHFNALPRLDSDMYYTWFLELKQSLPNLVLRRLPPGSPPCGSPQLLDFSLSLLQQDGGVFLGSNVIISRLPRDVDRTPFWFAFQSHAPSGNGSSRQLNFGEVTHGVIVTNKGFSDAKRREYLRWILNQSSPDQSEECVTPEVFNTHAPDAEENARCVVVRDKPDIYPVGIMYANSSFGQLARWLYYGTRSAMHPRRGEGDPIPRISHLVWFRRDRNSPYEMEFYQFLTVLSALHVGGFGHVYIHGNAGFRGPWWDKLAGENVTFVWMDDPEVVYQQAVNNPSHKSDIARHVILHKYGGAYHDFEAMWTMHVPDWLLDYSCVVNYDWAIYGEFPGGINPGVLLAKRHAPWLRYNLASHHYYIDKSYLWNAVQMSYKNFERHPDHLFIYRPLQVMCLQGICHPTWDPGFRRNVLDRRPTAPFDWRSETLVVHATYPDPEPSFTSPKALRQGTDMFADIGRHILQKSGRLDLIEGTTEAP